MAVRSVAVSLVAASGASIVADGTNSSAQAPQSFLVKAPATNTDKIFLGGSDVSAANGYPLAAGDPAVSVDLFGGDQLYALANSGTQTLLVLKTRS